MLFVFFQYVLPHLLPFLRCKISLLASALSLPRGSLDAIKKCNFPEAFARVSLPVAGDSRDCWRILCFLQAF